MSHPYYMEHRSRHEFLHHKLDELTADMTEHTGKLPSQTTVQELLEWSCQQVLEPTEKGDKKP